MKKYLLLSFLFLTVIPPESYGSSSSRDDAIQSIGTKIHALPLDINTKTEYCFPEDVKIIVSPKEQYISVTQNGTKNNYLYKHLKDYGFEYDEDGNWIESQQDNRILWQTQYAKSIAPYFDDNLLINYHIFWTKNYYPISDLKMADFGYSKTFLVGPCHIAYTHPDRPHSNLTAEMAIQDAIIAFHNPRTRHTALAYFSAFYYANKDRNLGNRQLGLIKKIETIFDALKNESDPIKLDIHIAGGNRDIRLMDILEWGFKGQYKIKSDFSVPASWGPRKKAMGNLTINSAGGNVFIGIDSNGDNGKKILKNKREIGHFNSKSYEARGFERDKLPKIQSVNDDL